MSKGFNSKKILELLAEAQVSSILYEDKKLDLWLERSEYLDLYINCYKDYVVGGAIIM